MHDELDLMRVDPTYNLVFDNGSQSALTSDMDLLRRKLDMREGQATPGL